MSQNFRSRWTTACRWSNGALCLCNQRREEGLAGICHARQFGWSGIWTTLLEILDNFLSSGCGSCHMVTICVVPRHAHTPLSLYAAVKTNISCLFSVQESFSSGSSGDPIGFSNRLSHCRLSLIQFISDWYSFWKPVAHLQSLLDGNFCQLCWNHFLCWAVITRKIL